MSKNKRKQRTPNVGQLTDNHCVLTFSKQNTLELNLKLNLEKILDNSQFLTGFILIIYFGSHIIGVK